LFTFFFFFNEPPHFLAMMGSNPVMQARSRKSGLLGDGPDHSHPAGNRP
jgi:hypothetical protein